MAPARIGRAPQALVVGSLRDLIDDALRLPSPDREAAAIRYAAAYPDVLRSAYAEQNLGTRRWQWLTEHGITTVGEPTSPEGIVAFRATITPEVKK